MTRGELLKDILSQGPISRDDLIEKMQEKGVIPVYTISILTGLLTTGEVVEKTDGMLYLGDS